MRHGRLALALLFGSFLAWSAAQSDDEPTPDEARDKAVAERFRKVLETNPRRGTALDKLYGYHVERGTLDKLVAEYADRSKKDAKDGTAWMVVGLLESQRGRDAAAVAAFRQAETTLPANAMPAYYLGQSLVLLGQPDAAAEAFERAITRKPNRADLLDAFQALGRVYQRSQRTEQALGVWNRLEKLFPDDARVQEQIATTLVEEGQFDQALPRLVKLADATDDKYRQTTLRMDAADLKVKLKRTPEALADFEKLTADLNPDSWLYRDVRRRIEDIFLRNDDLAGLAKYYESWLAKHPADVDAVARLAKNLASQGRAPEARDWLQKGLAAAPTHRGLRQALIDQYVFEQNFAAAAKEYEALEKADPNNPDTLREWGRLLMRDIAKPEAERRAAAAAVWRRLLEKKPNDPVVASQVADLMRTAGAVDDAIALYKKAIELAPNAPQYREYLGEYYHSLKRSTEALATWRPMAEGANRTSKNLARLGEVFAGFGYRPEAIAAMADAISLERDDFTLLMTYAELLHQEGRHDDALKQIALAGKLTSNPEEAEQVLAAEIKVYQASDTLGERIDELQKELDGNANAPAERWLRLARLYEANRQADKATETVTKATAKDPKSVPAMIAAARIYEGGGDILAAADANRKLAALDRRYRSEYLTTVAKLEQRLGRREQALQAGRDLLAASPGNPEVYKFFADLCFQLGDAEEGLEALRRSVRANPSDPAGLLTLASALSERVRQGEAIELLWRAFEKTNELEGKLGIIDRIAQLYLENNQFDRLLERLERERREAEKAREMTLCVAQAYTTAGDLGTARAQLERLLTENTRDTHLLGQLSTLCETEGDIAAAVKYQRQLNAAAPNNYDHQLRLAQLLTRVGEADEAADIWVKLVANETEPHRNLSAIDSLMTAGKHDSAVAVLSRLLARKPGDWELLYREGAALTAQGKRDEAAARFNAVLAMRLPDDEMGAITANQVKQAKKKATAAPKPGQPQQAYNPYATSRYEEWNYPPLTRRTQNVYQIRSAVGMDSRYYGGGAQPFYAPSDFGQARMACLGWQYEAARAKGEGDAFTKRLKAAKDKAGADPRALWDWYYFQKVREETKDILPTALALSKGSDPAGQLAFLNSLGASRGTPGGRAVRRGAGEPKDTTPPLPDDQLAHAVECYRKLRQAKPEWAGAVAQGLMTELKRAKRADDEQAVYRDLLKDANTVTKVQSALPVAAGRKDADACTDLFARLEKLQPAPKTSAALASLPSRSASSALQTLIGKLGEDKRLADARKVVDTYLASARRQNLTVPKSASAGKRSPLGGTSVGMYNAAGYYRQASLTFPGANDYLDAGGITLLYTAFDLHKSADLQSDLFTHYRKQLDAAQGAERLYAQFTLGCLHWWADEKDEALAALGEAVQLAPGDHGLVLAVASLREQANEFDAALAMLDGMVPLDTQTMQRREEAALRVAERTGNLDRARQAADRLFGLRLDADKQLELAGKMHRLGMHAMAETVLGRAQRQAGNKTATLLRLMSQYQSQNQGDLAVGIARQILRKGPTVNPNPRRGGDETDSARTQAIGVLARSGQLKEMVERAEAQLKASPKSVQIHQALVGYYQAAGDKAKVKATLLKMADLKPDDGKLRYQLAEQLQQAGERGAALDQYKIAIKLDPSVFANNYYQIPSYFAQANRLDELAKVLDEIDLRKLGYYYYALEPIASLMREEKTKDIGLKLFKKAWEAFPQNRGYMLGRLYDESVWRLPEMYGYARQAVIPREDSEMDPWQSATEIMSYQGDGRVDGVISRMLSVARKQQRLPELRAEVADALAKRPDWAGGKAILAVIEIQSGNKEKGKALWREAFDRPKGDVPALARFILAQELEFYADVDDLALATLEGGIDELLKEANYQFSYGPGRRLVWWYRQMGRTDDAKKLLMRFAEPDKSGDPGYGPGYWQYRMAQDGIAVAQEFMAMSEPVEAIRVYNRLLSDKDLFEQAAQYGGGNQYEQQVEQGLKAAYKALKPSALPAAVGSLLTPRPAAPVLDLVVLVETRDLTKSSLGSVLATAIKSTEKAPEVRRDALAKLADLCAQHPADFSVQVAAALAALADGKADDIQKAVDRLVKLTESTPLEPLPASGKANARHRAEALPQVALWLVARECLAKEREPLWPAGDKLAARSSAAAKRQQDVQSAAAILREWGQIELDRGNKAKAEALWGELLELAVPKPAPKKVAFVPSPAAAVALVTTLQVPAAVPATSASFTAAPVPPGRAVRGGAPALTAEQFQRAYEIATLAVEKGLPELSLRAMREALRGGPPLPPPPSRGGGGGYTQRTINGVQYLVSAGATQPLGVDQALVALAPKWRTAKVPAADTYALLAAAVLPEARPAEVFLHNEAQVYGQVYVMQGGVWTQTTDPIEGESEDRGLGALLARAAVEAGKADDLRTRLEARAGQPLGELPARLMLATLAVETKDEARALKAFEVLAERVKKDSTAGTNDRVAGVLAPALADAKYAAAVAPALQKVAENYAAGNQPQKAAELRFKLAEYHLGRKDEAAARAQFKAVEGFGKAVGRGAYDPHLPLARAYLKAGWAEEALAALGVHADAKSAADADPQKRARRADPSLDEFPRLVRLLLALPADRRYAALKAWTLPTADRKSIRYYVGPTPKHLPPPEFAKLPPVPADAIVSTMTLLTDAAKAVGKLDELAAEADKLVADKIDSAELLKVMVVLAQGQGKAGEPVVKAFAESVRKRLTAEYERPGNSRYSYYDEDGNYDSGQTSFRPSEYLFAALCLADPAFAAHGEALLPTLAGKAQGNLGYIDRIQAAQDRLKATRAGAADAAAGGLPPRWQAATPRGRWFAQDGYLTQPTSDQASFLLTDVPLTGTFEFSVDAWRAPYSDSHAGYGGVVFAPGTASYDSMVWAVGKNDFMKHTADGARYGQFNRLTVQVSPGKVRCLINGKLYFEDTDTPPTAPWPMLVAELGSRPVFRNFTMSGTPEVPAEVKLSAGDFLDGWHMHLSEGKLPRRLAAKERAAGKPANQQAWAVEEEPKSEKEPVYDWRAKAGEILGRKLERPSDKPVPSNLAYFRSLRPGETIRYEFFHEPGATHVHPSLGRLAFLIEPEGVKLHWLTDATADAWTGLAADNVIDAAEGRRGNVALKAGEWNTLTLTATDDGVTIDLNGTVVYESKLATEAERNFGLFHYRDRTAARVRNVVLTGPWPKAAGEITLATKPPTPAVAKARRWQLGERYYASEAGDVVARAAKLPPAERYKALADWVLPTESRTAFQLAGEVKPLDVLGVVDRKPGSGSETPATGRRVMLGGRFQAPCLEMVAAAKECGALDELAGRVAKAGPGADDELFRRSQSALLAVVLAAQGKDAEAADALRKLAGAAGTLKPDAPGAERWPDLIAVTGTLDRPALLAAATELARLENRNLNDGVVQKKMFDDHSWWERAFRGVYASAELAALPAGDRRPGADGFAHWASVPAPTPEGRSQGWGLPAWAVRNGQVVHFPGHGQDYLVLRTPLRGDFEVTCRLKVQDWNEARVRYGAYQFDLEHDWKKYKLHTSVRQEQQASAIAPPLQASKDNWYAFRLAVKDGWLRAFVDGREIASERIGANPDPWLMLHAVHTYTAEVRDLKIAGSPTVPDKINLLLGDDLGLWRSYLGTVNVAGGRRYYGEGYGNGWQMRGEEVYSFGKTPDPPDEGKPAPPRTPSESAAFYHRPLAEDGAVEYEFFYDPGKAHVHPALDRLTFLLEPDGVRLHWLTDGGQDKSGVPFDNATDEPACRRGPTKLPLKVKAWNKVRLAVAGDTVTVTLNDTPVYERPIEATNQRLFGLFHYTDRTEARVRSVTMTGDWPKQLPPTDRLFEAKK